MAGSRFRSTGAPTTALQSACSCSRWLRTSLNYVRILRGMGACRKKPAQPASGTLSWMTPSETLLRLCLGGFGDMKWAWGGGWRLPAFLCQTTSSPSFCPISTGPFSRPKNPFENVCTTRGLPCWTFWLLRLSGPCRRV